MSFTTIYEIDEAKVTDPNSYIDLIQEYIESDRSELIGGNIDYSYEAGGCSLIIEFISNEIFSVMYTKSKKRVHETLWSYSGIKDFSKFHVTDSDVLIPKCSFIPLDSLRKLIMRFLENPKEINIDLGWVMNSKLNWPEEPRP